MPSTTFFSVNFCKCRSFGLLHEVAYHGSQIVSSLWAQMNKINGYAQIPLSLNVSQVAPEDVHIPTQKTAPSKKVNPTVRFASIRRQACVSLLEQRQVGASVVTCTFRNPFDDCRKFRSPLVGLRSDPLRELVAKPARRGHQRPGASRGSPAVSFRSCPMLGPRVNGQRPCT